MHESAHLFVIFCCSLLMLQVYVVFIDAFLSPIMCVLYYGLFLCLVFQLAI